MHKSIFIVILFLTQVNPIFSQKTLDELNHTLFLKHPPLEIVGELDEKPLYAKAFDFYQSNLVELYSIESKDVVLKESIALPEDYVLQVFLYKETFFVFTSEIKSGDYFLLQLDANLYETKRIKLLNKKDVFTSKEIVPLHFRYFQKGNQVGISVKRTRNFLMVIDLENMTSASHTSDLKKDMNYTTEDCLFGNGLDAIFALGTYNDDEALVICKEQSHRNVIIPFTDKKTGDYRRSFKFVTTPEVNYLVSFYINKSKREQGYSLTPIPDFNFSTLELICFPDQTLNNPAIWTEGQYKKAQNGNLPIKNYYFQLVSAEYTNGFILLKAQNWHELGTRNIMISRIDLNTETPQVKWTFMSHFIADIYLNYTTKQGNQNFISFLRDNELHVLYNIQLNHITESGTPNLKDREIIGESSFQKLDTRVMYAKINLVSGEFTSKTTEPFQGSTFKGKLTCPAYQIEDDELIYPLYEIDYLTKQFSLPNIVSVPLE
jgi:hypothetical protein